MSQTTCTALHDGGVGAIALWGLSSSTATVLRADKSQRQERLRGHYQLAWKINQRKGLVETTSRNMEFGEENFFKIRCLNPQQNPPMRCRASEIGGNLIPLTLSLSSTADSSCPVLPFQSTALSP